MPTTYTDQFFVMDPGVPPVSGTFLAVTKFDFIDQNDDGWISTTAGDTANGLTINSVWVNDTITVTMGGSVVTITGVTFYLTGGSPIFTPTDGTVLQDAVFISSTFVTTSTQTPVTTFGPPCFVRGTLIETATGPRPVEDLRPGDLLQTRDSGLQPIRWIGERRIEGQGEHAPIRFAPGALGNARVLLVSPLHRILLQGWQAELHCGHDEVLVAAKHLVNGDTIHHAPCDQVSYFHILFDRHEIVLAEGVPSESFHPGVHILGQNPGMRAEILALFPELAECAAQKGWPLARYVAKPHEARLLAA